MPIAVGVSLPDAEIAEICRRYQVKELAVFGSAPRGDLGPASDVDLLVDFLPAARVGLLELVALSEELSDAVGRRVDLAVKPALKPRLRPRILAEAHVVYAA